jgi:hypothetical protein
MDDQQVLLLKAISLDTNWILIVRRSAMVNRPLEISLF